MVSGYSVVVDVAKPCKTPRAKPVKLLPRDAILVRVGDRKELLRPGQRPQLAQPFAWLQASSSILVLFVTTCASSGVVSLEHTGCYRLVRTISVAELRHARNAQGYRRRELGTAPYRYRSPGAWGRVSAPVSAQAGRLSTHRVDNAGAPHRAHPPGTLTPALSPVP